MIANDYGFYDKNDMADRLHGDIAHFAQKHGCLPTKVVFHPDMMPYLYDADGLVEDKQVTSMSVIDEKGNEYWIAFESDPRQLKTTYRIVREE